MAAGRPSKVPPCELLFNRKIQGTLPELTTKKVINKYKEAKENIDKRKNTNKKYYDVKKRAKAYNIKGGTVICEQKPVNKLSPRFNPEKFTVIKRPTTCKEIWHYSALTTYIIRKTMYSKIDVFCYLKK